MRLINVETRMFGEFVGANIPPYAILSHTWGAEEVTFPQYAKPESRLLKGYEKIEQSCRLAAERGLEYVWIDTCYIDKSSSAELSEAINSMFSWYKSARTCFVYLSDFEAYERYTRPFQESEVIFENDPTLRRFKKCRWFTRGWTLQEMLAPDVVEFFDVIWEFFGEKHYMISLLTHVTKIERRFFDDAQTASVAQKFSWAANRETTRVEDIAYCLLGLFDINMPLLYGEGEKAYKRLQLEILRSSDDESIFAWTDKSLWASGMLATSPSNFADSGRIVPLRHLTLYRSPYQMTHQGLQIELESVTGQKSMDSYLVSYLRCGQINDDFSSPEELVVLFIEPLDFLPRGIRARRVLPNRLEFRKVQDIEATQKLSNYSDSAGKGSFLVNEGTVQRLAFTSFEFIGNPDPMIGGSPDAMTEGKIIPSFPSWSAFQRRDAVKCSDGRVYVGVFDRIRKCDVVIIRLSQLHHSHLELFFPLLSQKMDYEACLSQIQTGQLEPFLLSKGGQIVHRVEPALDVFIALGKRFELEIQSDFVSVDDKTRMLYRKYE